MTTRMRGIIRGLAQAGLLAAVLAGCAVGAPASYQPTADTCYSFGVQALERHVTVTTMPRACAGLSHAQVNLAVARAIREVAGSHPKAIARSLQYQESGYLAYLIRAVPPARPVSLAIGPARRSTGWPASLAALAAWIVTAAAGSYLLAGWFADGVLRRRRGRATDPPPAIIVSHFAVAVAGLGIWIAFVATGVSVLAWSAVALILLAAGLGMATLVTALPEPAASPGPPSLSPPSLSPPSRCPPAAGAIAEMAAPARRRTPVIVIAVHGVLATVTILLVLLAAIGAG